jgi:hypothetical protein
VRRLLRLALAAALAIWAWRTFVGVRGPHERASVSFADGSELVLEPGSTDFEHLASLARTALTT